MHSAWKFEKQGSFNDQITCVKSATALGIPQGTEVDIETYWNKILDKAQQRVEKWKMRQLTLFGKVLVFKSLIISMFSYGATYIRIPNYVVKKLNSIMWSFIWDGKPESVQRKICMQQTENGGIGCIDISKWIVSKRIMLIKRVINGKIEAWKALPCQYFKCLDEKYGFEYSALKLNNVVSDIEKASIPRLYKECLTAWQQLKSMEIEPTDRKNIMNESIWCNKWITCNGTSLTNKQWVGRNICFLKDILSADGKPKYDEIIRLSGQGQNAIMVINGIMAAIPSKWLQILKRQQNQDDDMVEKLNECDKLVMKCSASDSLLNEVTLSSKLIYNCLNRCPDKNRWQIQWELEFNKSINWKQVYSLHKNKLVERKVKLFIWKSLHYGLNTKEKTERMKMGNGRCSFCDLEKETVMHLFTDCEYLKPIWHSVNIMVQKVLINDQYNLVQSENIMLGVGNVYVDFIIAYTKWILWKTRNLIVFENKWLNESDIYHWIQNAINEQIYLYNGLQYDYKFPMFK